MPLHETIPALATLVFGDVYLSFGDIDAGIRSPDDVTQVIVGELILLEEFGVKCEVDVSFDAERVGFVCVEVVVAPFADTDVVVIAHRIVIAPVNSEVEFAVDGRGEGYGEVALAEMFHFGEGKRDVFRLVDGGNLGLAVVLGNGVVPDRFPGEFVDDSSIKPTLEGGLLVGQ